MVTQSKLGSPREHLDHRIAALDAEVEQIQAEYGDPAAALGQYLIKRFGIEALTETYQEYLDHEDLFLDDDWNDGEEENGDGGKPA